MHCKYIGSKGTWREVANSANTTIHREEGSKEPSSSWKRRMLLSEHSPIRQIHIKAKWYSLKYWVSVHLVRHWLGIVHWVRSQREDRYEDSFDRNKLPQDALVEHEFEANTQAIINISKKRLCRMASKETREAWRVFLDSFKSEHPELHSVCVRECVYRNGFCPEYKSCGFVHTKKFENELREYIKGMEEQINRKTLINKENVNE